MLILSNFAERLKELMFDNNTTTDVLIEITQVNRTSVNRYLAGKCYPSVDVLVKIANHFKCTLDFILGIEPESYYTQFKKCPPFNEQRQFLLKRFGKTKYQLVKEAHITESALYYWQSGTHSPRINDVYKLSKYLECSMDYVIGRGN